MVLPALAAFCACNAGATILTDKETERLVQEREHARFTSDYAKPSAELTLTLTLPLTLTSAMRQPLAWMISPSVGRRSPMINLTRVVLPLPFSPSSTMRLWLSMPISAPRKSSGSEAWFGLGLGFEVRVRGEG